MKPKGTKDNPWTEDDIRRIAEMRGHKLRIDDIAARLGRTIHSVKGFIARCNMLRAQGINVYVPHEYSKGPSQRTLEDRSNRILASQRMSTTALLMGDPPPGYSARDRRQYG